jgi:hypothetical protein
MVAPALRDLAPAEDDGRVAIAVDAACAERSHERVTTSRTMAAAGAPLRTPPVRE